MSRPKVQVTEIQACTLAVVNIPVDVQNLRGGESQPLEFLKALEALQPA